MAPKRARSKSVPVGRMTAGGIDITEYLQKSEDFWVLDFSEEAIHEMNFALSPAQQEMLELESQDAGVSCFFKIGQVDNTIPNRANLIDAMLVGSRGLQIDQGNDDPPCNDCFPGPTDGPAVRGPFAGCIVWAGNLDNACANCIWRDNKINCSSTTANRKKSRDAANVQKEKDTKNAAREARLRNRATRET